MSQPTYVTPSPRPIITTADVDSIADQHRSINVNDPGLITLVNKLQDVFATVGVSYPDARPSIVICPSRI